ncbi:hypothetical protein D3C73_913560 [compost metagenome]
MLKQYECRTQLSDQPSGKGVTINVNSRFLQVNPALINHTLFHPTHCHINTRANNNLRSVTRFTGKLHQNAGEFTIEQIEVVGPFHAHLIGTQIA